MFSALFPVAAILLALLQLAWFGSFALVPLALVLLSICVDVVPATVTALVAGLTLDLLGLRIGGFPVSASLLALVGVLEILRLAVRSLAERPMLFALASASVVGALHAALRGTASAFPVQFILLAFAHVLVALAVYPMARAIGAAYQAYLRERGVIS